MSSRNESGPHRSSPRCFYPSPIPSRLPWKSSKECVREQRPAASRPLQPHRGRRVIAAADAVNSSKTGTSCRCEKWLFTAKQAPPVPVQRTNKQPSRKTMYYYQSALHNSSRVFSRMKTEILHGIHIMATWYLFGRHSPSGVDSQHPPPSSFPSALYSRARFLSIA